MERKPLTFYAECEDCHEKFSISKECVFAREFKINKRSIYITYYDCPECSKRHFVQIDDEQSLKLLETVKKCFVCNTKIKTKGQKLKKCSINQYKMACKRLSDYRRELMKEYNNKILHDDERNLNFKLRFSV